MRHSRGFDVFVALWVVGWVTLAVFVGKEVLVLRNLSDTVVKAGVAVRSSGSALGSLSGLPVVGPQLHVVANQAREAGRSAIVNGNRTRGSIETLAILLGIGVGTAGVVPVLVLYLPTWRRRYDAARDD